ncbi:hypothetical protein [Mesotoga sp.]|uniref:hypothetical protein n=1 Tax=Mesotoga sp. TaxID=2053577 RepID=UPI00345EC869
MKRVYIIVLVFTLISVTSLASTHSSRILSPGSVKAMLGFEDVGLRIGILSFLEAGWFIDEGPYFTLGHDANFHLASRVSFSSLQEARVVAELGYDFNVVYLEIGGLYEYAAPNASFLGGQLKTEVFFDNGLSAISATLGRFQKVAGETEKQSFTSVGFSARRRLDIDKKFYFLSIESVELVGTLKWEIKDDLSTFDPFPVYSFVGMQLNLGFLN